MSIEFKARGSAGEIWIYEQVGESFWGEGVSAKSFQKELTAMGKVSSINLHINSPGGNVFDGLAIYNQLKQHPARVVVDIDGLAASIASIIALAGDEIRIAANAMMMIHNPHGMAVGDATEMERVAALLKQVKGSLAETYVARTGQQRSKIEAWMDDETWMSAETAVQQGFADSVTSASPVSACFDLSKYRNTPPAMRAAADIHARTAADINAVRIQQQARRIASLA